MAMTAYPSLNPVSGAGHTKGAYVQIVASTPYDSSRVFLIAEFGSTGTQRYYLMDLATGGAGSETVIVANIAVHVDLDQIASMFIPLNVQIPAGTRLSIRAQCNLATSGITVHVYLDDRALASLVNPATYGPDTATSRGTIVDPGGTASTKGSYVQLTASTATRIDTAVLCLTHDPTSTTIASGSRWSIDVATGAAGAESIILPDLTVAGNSITTAVRPGFLYFPVSIAAGTRIAVRCNCNLTTSTTRKICVTLIGMQEPPSTGSSREVSVAVSG
jgi:hypothetical protein